MSLSLSLSLSFFLFLCPSVYLSTCLFFLSVCMSVYLSVCATLSWNLIPSGLSYLNLGLPVLDQSLGPYGHGLVHYLVKAQAQAQLLARPSPKSLYLQDQNCFYSIGIYRPCIYRKIPVNTGKMCLIAFILKTTGSCKFFLYLQDPEITEPCILIALGCLTQVLT